MEPLDLVDFRWGRCELACSDASSIGTVSLIVDQIGIGKEPQLVVFLELLLSRFCNVMRCIVLLGKAAIRECLWALQFLQHSTSE